MGLYEWTISRFSYDGVSAFHIRDDGAVGSYSTVNYNTIGIRPCFYLSSNVQIISGDGSKEEPYRLQLV